MGTMIIDGKIPVSNAKHRDVGSFDGQKPRPSRTEIIPDSHTLPQAPPMLSFLSITNPFSEDFTVMASV